ncbi:hypothetical protein CLTEP_02480 [Clostridium tepidiprofundi DSM 19306]|uniref:Uncharacterized protein n=1 Tax=Clostridium tepidiprofundi DSM 19306 TaxID=1121338 RepID=A0A151B7F5_9CLOT|nr:hypothetical protein [Clostridium tepidiprofundi]KYH35855.1 hypothetical protein CLTEP_02480 [Clostridium tepidiprofundi DSM 19306]
MKQFKIGFTEKKYYEVIVETTDDVRLQDMDIICEELEIQDEYAGELINDLALKGIKGEIIFEGPKFGEIEIKGLEELEG